MHRKLTVGSCFAGIGGIELGLEWTGGFETKWQIENDPYALAVLQKHWPQVVRHTDIRTVSPRELAPVDLICGGYPCQPFSLAGGRKGEGDPRHLWPAMFQIIRVLRPRYLLLENVPGHLSMGFGRVLGDLASCGYDAEWQVLSAAGVGAPHLRRRVFIIIKVSDAQGVGTQRRLSKGFRSEPGNDGDPQFMADPAKPRSLPAGLDQGETGRTSRRRSSYSSGKKRNVANASGKRSFPSAQEKIYQSEKGGRPRNEQSERFDWWAIEPNVGRVAHGVPSRVDRLKCLGNAVVPQVAQKVGKMILDFERRSYEHLR